MTWHGHVHAATLALPLAKQCTGQEQLENVVACPQQTSRDVPEVLFPSSPVVSGSSSCLLIWAPFPAYFCCLCSVALTGMCG